MASSQGVFAAAFASIQTITGIFFNSFIMIVSLQDQDGFSQSPSSQIQFTMGMTNVILQCVLATYGFVSLSSPLTFFSKEFSTIMLFLIFFLVNLSFWLTAWLSSFYCVTIVRFSNKFISSLRMKLSGVVPKLLFVTVQGSFAISVPSIWYFHYEVHVTLSENMTSNYTGNVNVLIQPDLNFFYAMVYSTIGCFLPLIITLTSIGFTLASLLGHVWRIKVNTSSSGAPQLAAHYRACRTMILLVTLYVMFSISEILATSAFMSFTNVWTFIAWYTSFLYPTIQAAILISGSSKMKIALCRLLQCMNNV
ncbi:taste receptor type 2 member 9-like [Discoglossus pictus]